VTADLQVEIAGRSIPVRLKRSPLARNMSLRLDPQDGAVLLVLPGFVRESQGLAFLRSKSDWLAERLAALPRRRRFLAGETVPYLGVEHELRPAPGARRGVWREDGLIHVSGRPEFFERRVADWLKIQAKAELTVRAQSLAAQLPKGRALGKVALRDTTSRWGSCTSRGDLTFSWRLLLAPEPVFHYVVAHEVAHLAEMNHSPAFWQVVEGLAPCAARDSRAWLKKHGAQLHRYG